MKEVVIIKMVNKKPTEIFFLSNRLISLTHQLHSLRRMIERDKRPYTNAMIKVYSEIKKDIEITRQALTGKFNVIIVRDFTNLEEVNEE